MPGPPYNKTSYLWDNWTNPTFDNWCSNEPPSANPGQYVIMVIMPTDPTSNNSNLCWTTNDGTQANPVVCQLRNPSIVFYNKLMWYTYPKFSNWKKLQTTVEFRLLSIRFFARWFRFSLLPAFVYFNNCSAGGCCVQELFFKFANISHLCGTLQFWTSPV